MASQIRLEDLTYYPRLMILSSIAWFFAGGAAGLAMVLAHLTGALRIADYNMLLTFHGVVMPFGGLFQLMMGLSLLRVGFCYGKSVKGPLVKASYFTLNVGLLLILAAIFVFGVRTSYTLMFPLPASGALKGLWSLEGLTIFVWGIILVLAVIITLYPASLARLMFGGKTQEAFVLERFVGTLNPAGMAGMLPYIFIIPPLGTAIAIGAVTIGLALLGAIPLSSAGWVLHPLNFNYPFWIWAHNLMEAMGIMAIGTVYWLIPRYTAVLRSSEVVEPRLYSEKLGIFAIVFYSTAAVIAFPHHLFTMPTSQPAGLSYTGQIASWLTGFGAAFSVFNVLATAYAFGLRLTPASLAAMLGFAVYIVDGFLAMQLGTIGWAYRLHGTYAVTAHLMTILLAVSLIWIGALYHSYRLLFGTEVNKKLAYIHIILTAVAALGLFYFMAFMGGAGTPRRAYPLPIPSDTGVLGLVGFGVLLAAAQAIFLAQLFKSLSKPHHYISDTV
jgi:cytochrome c oxidase subunit 1